MPLPLVPILIGSAAAWLWIQSQESGSESSAEPPGPMPQPPPVRSSGSSMQKSISFDLPPDWTPHFAGVDTEASAPSPSHQVAHLLEQPLPVAVQAARLRFMKVPAVLAVDEGEGAIQITYDGTNTDPWLIPSKYLGWPITMIEGHPRTTPRVALPRRARKTLKAPS